MQPASAARTGAKRFVFSERSPYAPLARMLNSVFVWIDLHPRCYWFVATCATLGLLGWIGLVAWREARAKPAPARALVADALLLFVFLLAWRWPHLLVANEFNP